MIWKKWQHFPLILLCSRTQFAALFGGGEVNLTNPMAQASEITNKGSLSSEWSNLWVPLNKAIGGQTHPNPQCRLNYFGTDGAICCGMAN